MTESLESAVLGCVAAYVRVLSKRNAKAVFGLGAVEFNALPCCGYRYYDVFYNEGVCYDKGIRDCAAAALKRLGSFKKLAEEAPHLRQNEPLQRLQGVIAELQKLHPTLQGGSGYSGSYTQHFKAIQHCAKRLKLRKSFRLKFLSTRLDLQYVMQYRSSEKAPSFDSDRHIYVYSAQCEARRVAVTQALLDLTLYIGAPFCSPHLMGV